MKQSEFDLCAHEPAELRRADVDASDSGLTCPAAYKIRGPRDRRAGPRRPLQFVRFVLVGVVNTVVGLACIFAAKAWLGWGDLAANAGGYGVGLLTSFTLNRTWTFGDRGRVGPALLRFLAAFALAYPANLATVFALRDFVQVDAYLAQAAGVVPYTILFFLASRAFVFLDGPPPRSAEPNDRAQ
jgi:putative flippase GtrA